MQQLQCNILSDTIPYTLNPAFRFHPYYTCSSFWSIGDGNIIIHMGTLSNVCYLLQVISIGAPGAPAPRPHHWFAILVFTCHPSASTELRILHANMQ